jgi:hypothetical protein
MTLLSSCCGSPVWGEIDKSSDNKEDWCGICSRCKDWSGVWDDEDEELDNDTEEIEEEIKNTIERIE